MESRKWIFGLNYRIDLVNVPLGPFQKLQWLTRRQAGVSPPTHPPGEATPQVGISLRGDPGGEGPENPSGPQVRVAAHQGFEGPVGADNHPLPRCRIYLRFVYGTTGSTFPVYFLELLVHVFCPFLWWACLFFLLMREINPLGPSFIPSPPPFIFYVIYILCGPPLTPPPHSLCHGFWILYHA